MRPGRGSREDDAAQPLASARPASFLIRVRPSEDGVLRGRARHVETGEAAFFEGLDALEGILRGAMKGSR